MRLSIRQDLGKNLCWRIGTLHWQKAVRAPGYFSHTGSTNVGRSLVDVLDGMDSAARLPGGTQRNFKALVHGWRASTTARRAGEALVTRSAARDAVEQLTPQMAIESILSKGWLRPGATPRQRREPKPDFCVRGDSVGAFGPSVFTKGRLIQRGAWYAEDETE
jgi:hypothetical protein